MRVGCGAGVGQCPATAGLKSPSPLWASALLARLTAVLVRRRPRAGRVLKQVATSGAGCGVAATPRPATLLSTMPAQPSLTAWREKRTLQGGAGHDPGRPVTLAALRRWRSRRAGCVRVACGRAWPWPAAWPLLPGPRDSQVDSPCRTAFSGFRVLAEAAVLDGTPESLQGQRIGVVACPWARGVWLLPPSAPATSTSFSGLGASRGALQAGVSNGVIGEPTCSAAWPTAATPKGWPLTPRFPTKRYADRLQSFPPGRLPLQLSGAL